MFVDILKVIYIKQKTYFIYIAKQKPYVLTGTVQTFLSYDTALKFISHKHQ